MFLTFDSFRLFFYFEPNFFLFIGKLGSFKFKTILSHYFQFKNGLLSLFPSFLFYFSTVSLYGKRICFFTKCKIFINWYLLSINIVTNFSFNFFLFFKKFILNIIASISVGWISRIRLIGIGYKMYHHCNLLLFKIGYTHYLIYLMPYECSISLFGKKKRVFFMCGINKVILHFYIKFLLCFRIPNVYTNKGLCLRGVIYKKKKKKKNQV